MSHGDFLSFEEFNRRAATPHTHTTPAAVAIAAVAAVYALFTFLDFLGYPVGFWIRRSLHAMAREVVRAASPAPSLDSQASDDSAHSGGLMGNLFGMGASVLSKGVRGVASALSRGPSDVPPGLGNYDNSCYQNSVIQGLAALPSLRSYLEKTTAEHDSLTADTTNGALLELISQLNDPGQRGRHFWVRGTLKSMSTFTQQDAQEYYSRILDELDTELKKASSSAKEEAGGTAATGEQSGAAAKQPAAAKQSAAAKQPAAAPMPLEGALAQRVGCTSCGYSEGLSLIPFNCITVSLGRRNGYDVRELLDDHTDLEYIDGVECSKCTLLKLKRTLVPVVEKQGRDTPFGARLRLVQDALDDEDLKDATLIKTLNIPKKNWVKSEKSKQVVVARAPKSLVLHVNRSIFDETTFAQYKNNAGVRYPSTLDLARWCLGTAPSRTHKPDLDPKTDAWPRDPKVSMLSAGADAPSPFQYRLRAAVTHFGTHGNGHYVCYRPHPRRVEEKDDTEPKDADEGRAAADPTADAKEDPTADAEEDPTADAEEDPTADAEEDPTADAEEDPTADAEEDPTADAEEDPTADAEEDPTADAEEDPTADAEEDPTADADPTADEADVDSTADADPTADAQPDVDNDEEQQQPPSEQWYRFSDDTVYAVSEQEAHQGNVFMLFYERIDDAPPKAPATEPPAVVAAAPLPAADTSQAAKDTQAAIRVALPSDDDEACTPPGTTSQATPPLPSDEARAAVEDTRDARADAKAEAETAPTPTPTLPKLSPHTMRTAGNASTRNSGSRASLQLVSAS
ncbi:cysteine proteinase [Didymella exigua CBS 183.55]|uniref:ubiquitinyl hydrolase 1 n=1 Tax=Didymella exigua CBS 183.55 TaxID=1150837 RepID=A0A6A5R6L2_9PLEO|nr:cysteine proteinase [Didymella exigua CBS 183.55]KAF1922860.1 cysteine proteinase [Didymella exigua CBS 183.55]